ncbi:MAG: hypothetical protein L0271_14160, partial [Gemmatimonadetes bacterium]|nr:hypothetical protein [Gemmatimonadota bacterium]
MSDTATCHLRLGVPSCFPHARYVVKPQISCFYVDCALGDMLLDVRILGVLIAAGECRGDGQARFRRQPFGRARKLAADASVSIRSCECDEP